MIRVLSANAGADTAGVGYAIADAFRRHPAPGIHVRSAARRRSRFAYPADLPWADAPTHYALADVAHFHNTVAAHAALGGGPWRPFVLHHHGTRYRSRPGRYNAFMADPPAPGQAVVATRDRRDLGPHHEWVPHPRDRVFCGG